MFEVSLDVGVLALGAFPRATGNHQKASFYN
jgi:hypothetical protein